MPNEAYAAGNRHLGHADIPRRFEVFGRITPECDHGIGALNALNFGKLARNRVVELVMVFEANDRHEVMFAGNAVNFDDIRDISDFLGDIADMVRQGID